MSTHPAQPVAWITGAAGLIGNSLLQTAPVHAPRWSPRPLTRPELDLTCFDSVTALFHREQPALIIHCAALSRSPDCQKWPDQARLQNIDVTAHLANLASNIPMIFLSSDLVFDGQRGNYTETDPVNPLSVYGETKAAAEELVLRNPAHTVVRTSLNGGISPSGVRGFNEELRQAWQRGVTLRLFTDEFRSPIPAIVTARALWELAAQENKSGLFHLGGATRLSRWQIGRLIADRWPQLDPKIEADTTASYTGAPRPPDCSLNSAKLQKRLSFPLPTLGDWLREHPDKPF